MLEVKNLNVYYGEIQSLWDVNIKIEKGSIVSILGPNGAGKSTLIKAISGLLMAQSGQIIFEDKDFTNLPANKRVEIGISLTPEGRGLFPFMTVEENLILGNYNKRAKLKRDQLLQWVLDLFPRLNERLKQPARTLSGGEQQMLAVGRSLMSDPSLIILDEPSLGLAPIIVNDLFKIFSQINKMGVTVLISEQHVHMALKISNQGYVLEEGKTVLQGKSSELANHEHIKLAYLGI